MLITLEVLKEKGASMAIVKNFQVKYFQCLEKQEYGVVELIKRTHEDRCLFNIPLRFFLFKCIDSNDELREIAEYYIKKNFSFGYIFKYCNELFKNDIKLFEEVVRYYMKNGWLVCDVLEYCGCGELFKDNLELFEEAVRYQMKKGLPVCDVLEYCGECFKQLPELHKNAKLYQRKYNKEWYRSGGLID